MLFSAIKRVVKPFLLQAYISLFFLHLLSSNHKSTHPCCNAAQKIKSSMMKTSSRRAGPRSSACGVVLVPPRRPLGLVISSVIRLDVINTGYIIYFTICHFMCET
jgi:hypothetical protein